MKENSIEEDIKILTDYMIELNKDIQDTEEWVNTGADEEKYYAIKNVLEYLEKFKKENQKLNTILSDYKRVLKENEELKNEIMEKELEVVGKEEYTKASMGEIIEQYYTANEDCITKQRIEDIIDRINYDIKKTKEIISNGPKNNYQITRLKAMNTKSLDIKKRLQELLESEK